MGTTTAALRGPGYYDGAGRLRTDVVVVGAGPVGLLLAAELRLGGARVVVLESRLSPSTESRASTLHARTMEIFDNRGLLGRFGTPPNDRRGHLAGLRLDLTVPSPFPGQWKVLQARTEQILQERAQELGADLRRGHVVQAVTQDATGVETVADSRAAGQLRIRARYLVACDGQDSSVRSLIGAPFPGQEARRRMLRADVAGIDIRDRRFERLERGLAVSARRPDGVTRVMVHEFGQGDAGRAELGLHDFPVVTRSWKNVTGEDIGSGRPLWVNMFGDASRQLDSYRHGRVLFAGDAAHQQMPVGGQALNLGLQDAFNLGWKLALRVRTDSAEALLDTYDAERRAVGRAVLTNIRAQADLLLGGPEVEPVRQVLAELLTRPGAARHLAEQISGVSVRHPAPDATDQMAGLFVSHQIFPEPDGILVRRHLRLGRGTLLLLGEDDLTAGLRGMAGGWARRVDVVALGPDRPGDLPSSVTALLVRPDGHVVWTGGADPRAARAQEQALQRALTRWFGGKDKLVNCIDDYA
jgi:2-polyprenyl-6-methoxyphenol hydroxylase-like FAD-dependent oxidoreductase